MEKKVYIQPSLKATELDEELLAGMSGGGDVNVPGDDSGEGDGSDAAARQHGVWDTPEEINGQVVKGVWDE